MASPPGRPRLVAVPPGKTGPANQGVLARIGGLEVTVERDCIVFDPALVGLSQFGTATEPFRYTDATGEVRAVEPGPDSFAFTLGATLVVAHRSGPPFVAIVFDDGSVRSNEELALDRETSAEIVARTGRVRRVDLFLGLTSRPG